MPAIEKHDYNTLLEKARELILNRRAANFQELAELLGVKRTTMVSGLRRKFGIKNFKDISGMEVRKPLVGDEAEDAFSVEMDGNDGVIRSVQVAGQIKTIPQLLKHAGIDAGEYYVHNPEVKKWDVAIKVKSGKDVELVKVVPSIYIKAPLRAKHPLAFEIGRAHV